MRASWAREVRKLLLLVLLAAVVGWLFGMLLPALVAMLFGLQVYGLLQLWRIHHWLSSPDSDPPEGIGLWGDVYDKIYTLRRQNLEAHAQLQSTVDYLRDSFGSMRDGVVMLDSNGDIEWCNKAAFSLLGLRFPQDKGQGILNLLRAPQFHQYFLAGDFSQPLHLETHVDPPTFLRFDITGFGEGDRLMFVRDVTNIHRLEKMRRDFVANVSHELRTPLTVISGYLGTLLSAAESIDERVRKPLQQMEQQAQRMENLLKDLLWLARLESVEHEERREFVDIGQMLRDLQSELSSSHPGRVIELLVETEHKVPGDRHELYSAVSNLVLNALKYSPQDSPVTISWNEEGGQYLLSVIDQGAGIEASHIPRLTERFYRVDDSRASDTGGTGLGLAIVKHIAAGHNAQLQIESVVGLGSKFILVFQSGTS